jgi:ENTS family enterobactin (siderophore) exporter
MARLSDHTIDLRPLRESPTLRDLWVANTISAVGSRLTAVAMVWQVFEITDSKAQTGLLGLCVGLPYLLLSMYGGVLADRMRREWILIATALAGALGAGLLWVNALADAPPVWPIFVLATFMACAMALGSPARMALAPLLVRSELIPAAAALNQVGFQIAFVGGPALAGVLIAGTGVQWTYFIDAASYLVSLVFVVHAGALPRPEASHVRPGAAILEGVAFLRTRKPLQASFLADIIAMIFGYPSALLPAVVAARYDDNEIALGFLYSAVPMGMLAAGLLSGWTGRVYRHGLGVIWTVSVWGVAIAMFAFTGPFWLSMVVLAVAGAGDAISGIFRMSILQTGTPPAMMGRIMGIGMAVWAAGPSLGDAEAGLLAEITSTDFSIAFGGIACVVGIVALGRLWPAFRNYDVRNERPAEDPNPAPA